MSLFQGLSAFPISPMNETGVVDTTILARILEPIVKSNVDSLGLLGSNGGYVYLSRQERRRVIETAIEVVSGHIPIMVGIGALRTNDAISLAVEAETSGVDAVLLAPVSYIPLSQEEVFQHFKAVASSIDIPLCIYNNPTATHFHFSEALLVRLSHISNIQGVKMPSPNKEDVRNQLERLKAQMPKDFKIGYSGDPKSADAVARGGAAWYSGMAGVLPKAVLKLCRTAQMGDIAEVDGMNANFAVLWELCQSLGTMRVIYGIANMRGLFDGHPPLPISPLSRMERANLEGALSNIAGYEEH